MIDVLLTIFRQSLPAEVASLTEPYLKDLETGEYKSLLRGPEARSLFGHDVASNVEDFPCWHDFIFHRLGILLADRSRSERQPIFFCIGYAALLAFIQSNVTGPPLTFNSATVLFPSDISESRDKTLAARHALLESLGVDGIAVYKLAPNIELLCLAEAIMTCPPIIKNIETARWAKMRVGFMHQRLLSESSSTLQNVIYDDIKLVEEKVLRSHGKSTLGQSAEAEFLLEKATVHIHHGLDKLARADLERAKDERHFEFAMTGFLGKRTKFQQKDVSQLVVLARSHESSEDPQSQRNGIAVGRSTDARPTNLNLDDDTLLESISFTPKASDSTRIVEETALPGSLVALDPSDQPQLEPLDATLLLSLASSITNTSPQDGLTREETLPYATRVLEGGSSNWQVYTQALLVRSRTEGYKSRTVERGLLQLQALVDQVIADTTDPSSSPQSPSEKAVTSFLPRAKESESASAAERLRYIFQLASPARWDLEAELATRWVELGGLRSALEIYERLEMWAEVALCWAATEREDKARRIVRRQLFHSTNGLSDSEAQDDETWSGQLRNPPPFDAPRLYCILGDMDQSPEMYEKAWEVSQMRYSRAQRSLGRHYFSARDFVKAAEAYSKSLKVDQLNHTSWFALGCALLELSEFDKAVEAFSRCVQLDETDGEAWSNLAAALLRKDPNDDDVEHSGSAKEADEDTDDGIAKNDSIGNTLQRNRKDALKALKRAAVLKHDSYRIWENALIVSASISPPDYDCILAAQKRIIDLRGPTDGENCIDVEVFDLLVQHIISMSDTFDPLQPGLPRMLVKFVDENVTPLITASAKLWRLVSKLSLWRNKPSSALEAEEKAWRAITSQPGWETESEKLWNDVVEATVRLCDSYESLGPRERTEGLGAGELVAKDWKFKARSAVRGILGRGKPSWDGTEGWDKLTEAMEGLRA